MKPAFSIITVTFNASQTIDATIKSIKEQTFTDFEFIVMDGASKDDTLEKIRNANINNTNITSEPDKGLYDAMNKAIKVATGEFLIFLNAGDTFSDNDALHRIADTAKRTHADVVYGQTQLINEKGEIVGMRHLTAPKNLTFDSFKHGMLVCHQAFIVRNKIAPQYDLSYRFSADYEWCLRVLKKSARNAYVGGTIINFLQGGTTNKNHKSSLKERFRIMCKYYGYIPTVLRHIAFIPRYINAKSKHLQ